MARTIKEWKRYYTPLPEGLCETLIEGLTRKACIDVQEICGIAERLKEALTLANSMILSGEKHNIKSKTVIDQALKEGGKR